MQDYANDMKLGNPAVAVENQAIAAGLQRLQ